MRQRLSKLGSQQRFTFRGEFERYGYKHYKDYFSPTLLLTNVMVLGDDGEYQKVTGHLWLNLTKGFQTLGLLKKQDIVQFNGRVDDYYKGYFTSPKRHDFKLSFPSKVSLVSERTTIPLPADKNAIVGLIMNLNWSFYTSHDRLLSHYCLVQFKGSTEYHTYDYGVKAHVTKLDLSEYNRSEPGDLSSYAPHGLAFEQYQDQLKAGKTWLVTHQNDIDANMLKSIVLDSLFSKEEKLARVTTLLKPIFTTDLDLGDSTEIKDANRRMANAVILYLTHCQIQHELRRKDDD